MSFRRRGGYVKSPSQFRVSAMSYLSASVVKERVANPWNRGGRNNLQKSVHDKFRSAQEKLQAAVQKHLKDEYESSSEEEILESDSILDSVFKNYSQYSGYNEGVEKTRQFLVNSLQSGSGICLICIARIKQSDPIWSCCECYGYFHLTCIQKWSRDSIYQQKAAQEELPSFIRSKKINWACPKCRHEYEQNEVPQKYHCFCGKVEDPEQHPWLLPHSCGDVCSKPLQPECGHLCLLLCHPGACPPCPKTVQSYCHCQKQGPELHRCSNKLWSCNSRCGKPLTCKKHFCEESCHSGECPPCNKESKQKCMCRLQERKQPCFNPFWQCDKVCGKPYSCGFHNCMLVCHKGQCGDCPLSKERTCPCGKMSFLLPCTKDVSTCNDTCEKLLDCGSHRCLQKCHKEKCGMCLEIVSKVCRCGQHRKELPCQKEFLCETKCKRPKNCGRHSCNRKCCDSVCPPCEKPCGRTLKCGYHKCPSVCHRGECYPCPQVAQVKCRCGSTVLTVACGRQKKTSPPKCNEACGKPPDCHHPSRTPHNCHFGECPPCEQVCGKSRDNCPHTCSAPCHSAVWVKVEDDRRPAGPWEECEPKQKRVSLPCPDCRVPVPVTCLGGHETCDRPCYQAKPSSCQRPCGRLLKCGNHTCSKPCHAVDAGPVEEGEENCSECESACLKQRAKECVHGCPNPCHPGPCPPCSLSLKMKCHCGISLLYLRCGEYTEADEKARDVMLSCKNECPNKYPCDHSCPLECHSGPCPGAEACRRKVKLSCKCGRIKREVTCDVVRASKLTAIDCKETCFIKKSEERRAREEKEGRQGMEEERKNREEVERFKKKFEGKKKHKEKIKLVQQPSFLSKYWIIIVGGLVGVVATFIYHKMH